MKDRSWDADCGNSIKGQSQEFAEKVETQSNSKELAILGNSLKVRAKDVTNFMDERTKEEYKKLMEVILHRKQTSRIEGSPWKRLANAKEVEINLGTVSSLLDRRLGTTLAYKRHKNQGRNKFMTQMIRNLRNRRKNGEKYWKLAERLMLQSTTFRLTALNHVLPTWYKSITQDQCIKIMEEVNKILNSKVTPGDFWRFYVEKANGRLRPIGAPTVPWRVVLHMMNNFLTWYIQKEIDPDQHAYSPNKGVGTAWRSILEKSVLEKPYVMEFDIKGFFDNVSMSESLKILKDKGVPERILSIIKIWHSAKPKRKCWAPEKEYEEEMLERNLKSLKRHLPEWENLDDITKDCLKNTWTGGEDAVISFAQGSPMSPLLSTILLGEYLKKQKQDLEWVIYADDGIVYGNQEFDLKDDEEMGITIERKKTRWIRKSGRWETGFKFLGIEYDPNVGMRVNTRNGGVIELREDYKGVILALRRLFMPELIKEEKIKFEKRLPTLRIEADTPWEAYHIAKSKGTFGQVYADRWVHYDAETAKRKFGDTAKEKYFDWDHEPRPERGRDLVDMKLLAETGLWDWFFSVGFNEKREKPSGVLEWKKGSQLEKIVKHPRKHERVKINTQNASSLSIYRIGPSLKRTVKRKKDHLFTSLWLNPTTDTQLWIDLYEGLQKAVYQAKWSISERVRQFFVGSRIKEPISVLKSLYPRPTNVGEEWSSRAILLDYKQRRRVERSEIEAPTGWDRTDKYILERTKKPEEYNGYLLESRSIERWPYGKDTNFSLTRRYGQSWKKLVTPDALFPESIRDIAMDISTGPNRIESLYKRLKKAGRKDITRHLKPKRKDEIVRLHIDYLR